MLFSGSVMSNPLQLHGLQHARLPCLSSCPGACFADKGLDCQSYGLSSSHAWVGEIDHKEGWAPKNWCFWTVVLEILESPLNSKEIKPVNSKWNQIWIFIGSIYAEAKALILQPLDGKSWHIGKDPDAGKYWGQEETGKTDNELIWWHHWFIGHKFEETQWDSDGQRSLVCCSSWGCKVSYMTSRLKNSNKNKRYLIQS